jgi:RNA polymerase sigma-70 factor (ECF subfamily)
MVADVIGVVQPVEGVAWNPAAAGARGDWFDAIFREHYPRVVGVLARLTGDRAQAEEIASDVFCKLSRRPGVFAKSEDVTAWLYRVATNAGFDAWRANSRRRKHEEAAGVESLRTTAAGGALDELLREERCARVRVVLASLKSREAELLLLRASGMAYRELAEAVGVQPGSVGTLLARAEVEFERRFRARYGDNV